MPEATLVAANLDQLSSFFYEKLDKMAENLVPSSVAFVFTFAFILDDTLAVALGFQTILLKVLLKASEQLVDEIVLLMLFDYFIINFFKL